MNLNRPSAVSTLVLGLLCLPTACKENNVRTSCVDLSQSDVSGLCPVGTAFEGVQVDDAGCEDAAATDEDKAICQKGSGEADGCTVRCKVVLDCPCGIASLDAINGAVCNTCSCTDYQDNGVNEGARFCVGATQPATCTNGSAAPLDACAAGDVCTGLGSCQKGDACLGQPNGPLKEDELAGRCEIRTCSDYAVTGSTLQAKGAACARADGSDGFCDGGEGCVQCFADVHCADAGGGLCQADGTCADPACSDAVKNGDESAVDCGGSCDPCADAKACNDPTDCVSGVCANKVCQAPRCDTVDQANGDDVPNGTETGVDCGGKDSACKRCGTGEGCLAASDCASLHCEQQGATGTCLEAACDDGIQNQNETAIDCGGPCDTCAPGKPCAADAECASDVCSPATSKCLAATCSDGKKNGFETDLDCGGPCMPCADNLACASNDDCTSAHCQSGKCVPVSCTDGVKNQGESALDCGGPCSPCSDGAACAAPSDCSSGVCASGLCAAPACNDGLKNGNEVGKDCGGPDCEACTCAPSTAQSCYSGPQGTQLVGTCSAGARVCNPEGSGYGPCLNEVLPAPEDCSTTSLDENCDGQKPACNGKVNFKARYGTSADDGGSVLAADGLGNVFVAGLFTGPLDFGPGPLTSAGSHDVYIAKFDSTMTPVWVKSVGGGSSDNVSEGLAADAAGNVYFHGSAGNAGLVGMNAACPPLGNVSNVGDDLVVANVRYVGDDLVVAKLDASGECIWRRNYGTSVNHAARSVAVVDSGEVLIAGAVSADVKFGGLSSGHAGGQDAFIARLSKNGLPLQVSTFGDGNDQSVQSVTSDAAGFVYVSGFHKGSIDFGCGVHSAPGTEANAVVAKLNPDLSCVWSKSYGDSAHQDFTSANADAKGNVFIVGTFAGTLTGLCATPPVSGAGGDRDMFVAKLDPTGACVWAKGFGGPNEQKIYSARLDPFGDILIGGNYHGTPDFGGGPLPANETAYGHGFVAKLEGDTGAPLWSHATAGKGEVASNARAVVADSAGRMVAAGFFESTMTIDGQVLGGNAGGYDVWLARFDP